MTMWNEAKLRALSVHERHTLWVNAKTKGAQELVQMIEACGLPFSDSKALTTKDPLFLKMMEIIFSEPAKQAALAATSKGQPALLEIDPMLLQSLGVDYNPNNQATNNAGYIVAEMMRTLGYRTTGRKGKLPSTCVAKSAEIYEPIK